jgi:hypothetical protein
MVPPLKSAIVRIYKKENGRRITIGAGFLIDESHILTCAHVVSIALGIKDKSRPNEEINLDFPFIGAGSASTAHILSWQPPEIHTSGGETNDIAVLQLSNPKPESAKPIDLILPDGEYSGDDFRAYGFPSDYTGGAWAYGVVRDVLPSGRLQIENLNVSGVDVQAGFSGTPVWNENKNGIIGMIVEAAQYDKVGFIIPINFIIRSCPEIKDVLSNLNSYASVDTWPSLMKNIDLLIRDDQYKSVRPLLSKLQPLANSKTIELDIASDMLVIIKKMQLEIHHGGKFRSIFEHIEKGIFNPLWQINSINDPDKKKDLLRIVDFIFCESRDQLRLDPGIPIPIILLVMNDVEAQELLSGAAFESIGLRLRPQSLPESFSLNMWVKCFT